MARTAVAVRQLKVYDGAAGAGEFEDTWQAADTVNGNAIPFTGREIIKARNVNASTTARTLTVGSAPDPRNQRTGDIPTYSIPAGKTITLDILPLAGWRQADGNLYVDGSNAEVEFLVVRLPDCNIPPQI